jgi:winged helix DNA-binding protein
VLVKAWTVRGTLHLHPADELPLWLAARRAVTGAAELPAWPAPDGVVHPALSADEVAAVRAAVWEALDGRCLLREEIAEAVGGGLGSASRARLRSGFAFFLGDLCQGPPQGTKVTFARPDQWIDDWRDIPQRQALEQVCLRFLRTYGPARPSAFREWFGAADAASLFESLAGELEEVEAGDGRAFVARGDIGAPIPTESVRLLPEYDVYVMGFRERDELVLAPVRDLVTAHGRGRYEGPAGVRFVIVDGVAAGLWERTKRSRRIELRVTLARRLTRAQRDELAAESERIGSFLGLEPVLVVETAR